MSSSQSVPLNGMCGGKWKNKKTDLQNNLQFIKTVITQSMQISEELDYQRMHKQELQNMTVTV